ncbi:LIM domain protein [Cooperia oncophora]
MKEPCFRCKRPTYFNDKIGPLKDGALFHKGCFKCWICGTRLSLKTYHNNRNDTQDLEVKFIILPEDERRLPSQSDETSWTDKSAFASRSLSSASLRQFPSAENEVEGC